jgi:hypothetical protein
MSSGVLLNLEQRVSTLEQQIAGVQGSEALQPNYLTIDPITGLISASFSGFVDAAGVRLPTWLIQGSSPVTSSEVVWNNPSTGLVDGGIVVERDTSGPNPVNLTTVQSRSEAGAPADVSQSWLEARDDQSNLQAGLYVSQQNEGATAQAVAQTGSQVAKILDQAGSSSFPRWMARWDVFGLSIAPTASAGGTLGLPAGLTFPSGWAFTIGCFFVGAGGGGFMDWCAWTTYGFSSTQFSYWITNHNSINTASGDAHFYTAWLQ